MRSSSQVLAVAALLCVSVALAADPKPPTWPNTYTVDAMWRMPYVDINEPITAVYDAVSGRQRMDYYNGQDSYYFYRNAGITYEVVPVYKNLTCFTVPGAVSLQSILPDLSSFKPVASGLTVSGSTCQQWNYTNTVGSKVNTYSMYVDEKTGAPVRYEFLGYNTLLGSHYDQYIVEYSNWKPNVADSSAFKPPSETMSCGGFPGPGLTHRGDGGVVHAFSSPLIDILLAMPHGYELLEREYDEHARAHGRKFADATEQARRLRHFSDNLRYVRSHNRRVSTFKLAVNHMADWSVPERSRLLGAQGRTRPSDNGAAAVHKRSASGPPASVDWRGSHAVGKVMDQGVCGSCWTFGFVGTMEGTLALAKGAFTKLSEQAVLDCSWSEGTDGCDGGEDFRGARWILEHGGRVATTSSYGAYTMVDGYCHYDKAVAGGDGPTITGYVNVTSGDEDALKDAVATKGPISISIDAALRTFSFYSSGVFADPTCGNTLADLDHTVLLVGYGATQSGQGYWIVRNSWSTHWGDQGYVQIATSGNLCGVATSPVYTTM